MREIVLDTETTGFDPAAGDRIVEIGAVELLNHLPTGRTFHKYINPQRDMPQSAFEVHGLSTEFLSTKPLFKDIAAEFLDFIGQDQLVIHNAAFDMKFLNSELRGTGMGEIPYARATDTLMIARSKFPGSPASLDALCRRFGVNNSARQKHGALLDSEILAEVYLELIGGRQPDLTLSAQSTAAEARAQAMPTAPTRVRPAPLPSRTTDAERAAHQDFVAAMGPQSLWAQRTT